MDIKSLTVRPRCFDPMPPESSVPEYELLVEHVAESDAISKESHDESDTCLFDILALVKLCQISRLSL